jgi:hypothetical protein
VARLAALVAALLALALSSTGCGSTGDAGGQSSTAAGAGVRAGDAALARAFEDRVSGLEVEGAGAVERLLADDEQGSRHQRFILRLATGQTLLVAHNIDVAPRIDDLRVGDTVAFRGVYEWSERGGTIHWTHHDPSGEHAAGWLRHGGRAYQ